MDGKMVNRTIIVRKDTPLSLISVVFLFCIALLPIQLQAQPSVEALMAKGDSCRRAWHYNKALIFFQQAYDDPSVTDNPTLQMQLLERIMRTHYVLCHWKEFPEASYQLSILPRSTMLPPMCQWPFLCAVIDFTWKVTRRLPIRLVRRLSIS